MVCAAEYFSRDYTLQGNYQIKFCYFGNFYAAKTELKSNSITVRHPSTTSLPMLEPIFRALPRLYAVLTPDLVIVEITDILLKGLHLTREQILGHSLFDLFPNNPNQPESRVAVMECLQHALVHKEPFHNPRLRYDIQLGAGYEELGDLRTVIAEDLRAVGAAEHARKIDHAQAGKGAESRLGRHGECFLRC